MPTLVQGAEGDHAEKLPWRWFTAAWQADTWNENWCTFRRHEKVQIWILPCSLFHFHPRRNILASGPVQESHDLRSKHFIYLGWSPLQLFATTWHFESFIFCSKRGECEEFTDWFCRRVRIFLAPISQNSLQMFNQFVLAEEPGAEQKVHTLQTVCGRETVFIKPQLMYDFMNNYDIGKQSPFEIFWSASRPISLWSRGPEVSFWLICSNIFSNSSKETIEEFRVVVFSSALLVNVQSLILIPNWWIP